MALKTIVAPWRTHDMAHAAATHDALGTGDILVGDRAFASFGHLAVLLQRGLHGVFRAHQVRKVHRQRGSRDRYVTYDKPVHKPAWMTDEEFARLPGSMLVREVRVRLNEPGLRVRELVLVTTLLDAVSYPPSMIAQMFGVRWSAEVNLRHLKQTLGLDVLRSRSVDGILKELHAFVIIYNLVRKLMCAAARRQKVAPDRISFVDTLRWLRSAQVINTLPTLLVIPHRPGRHQPRVKISPQIAGRSESALPCRGHGHSLVGTRFRRRLSVWGLPGSGRILPEAQFDCNKPDCSRHWNSGIAGPTSALERAVP